MKNCACEVYNRPNAGSMGVSREGSDNRDGGNWTFFAIREYSSRRIGKPGWAHPGVKEEIAGGHGTR